MYRSKVQDNEELIQQDFIRRMYKIYDQEEKRMLFTRNLKHYFERELFNKNLKSIGCYVSGLDEPNSKTKIMDYNFDLFGFTFAYSFRKYMGSSRVFFTVDKREEKVFDFVLFFNEEEKDEFYEELCDDPCYDQLDYGEYNVFCYGVHNYKDKIKFVIEKLCDSHAVFGGPFVRIFRESMLMFSQSADIHIIPKYDFTDDIDKALELAKNDYVKNGDLIHGDDSRIHSISVVNKNFDDEGNRCQIQLHEILNPWVIPKNVTCKIKFPHLFYADLLNDQTIQAVELCDEHDTFLLKYLDSVNTNKYRYLIDADNLYVESINDPSDFKTFALRHETE